MIDVLRVGAYSYIGGSRAENQDRYGILPNLWIIADGMGGYRGGSQAASTAVNLCSDYPFDPNAPVVSVRQAMIQANKAIHDMGNSEADLRGMGTTLTLGYLVENTLYIGHVGDSRIYLVREGLIRQLTQDHSFVAELLRDGTISPDEALNHPNRNILTRALGVSPELQVDVLQEEVGFDDTLVFCTDGVSGVLEDSSILKIIQSTDNPHSAAETLCREAERHGSTDNSTAIVVFFLPPGHKETANTEMELESILETELSLV